MDRDTVVAFVLLVVAIAIAIAILAYGANILLTAGG
jgi:hypothetical protein